MSTQSLTENTLNRIFELIREILTCKSDQFFV